MKIKFQLPPKGYLKPNDDLDDPLRYYYHPIVGCLYRQRVEQALSLLSPPYESILEIGYGSGLLLPTLKRLGGKISGIDLKSDPDQTSFLLKSMGVYPHLIKGDIADQVFHKDSFDLIVAISVFEHISDPIPILNKIHYMLTEKGLLLVGMPRVDALMSKLFYLIGYSSIGDHHVFRHTDFLKCSQNNFTLVSFKKMPSFLPQWAGLYFNMLLKKTSVRDVIIP
jgi:2-polyprenyl-3-methyl-5-hydroxy-6-metoxy-1,4-benzoquinol methylase